MPSNKAAASDGLPAEVFKACPEETAEILEKLFTKVWEEKFVPEEHWLEIFSSCRKKGIRMLCDNWRGVTLLNVAMKIFARASTAYKTSLREY